MDFSRAQIDPRRNVLGVAFVMLFHAVLVYALMSGLARKVVDMVRAPIDTRVIEEIVKPPPPPEVVVQPPPKLDAPPPPFIPPPEVQVAAPPQVQPTITAAAEAPVNTVITPMAPAATPAPAAPAAPSVGVSCPGYKQVMQAAGYPREAMRAQIDRGEVLVSFSIGTQGEVKNAAIVRSTHRAFNKQSLETVAQFKCNTQPQEIAGVQVPLVFNMQ
ncbi:MAG TPA: TonB family protein [Rhizobacter sp.]|nr:TonB family protein [Rhizobacter sp.]